MITITVTPETSSQMSIIAKALIALLADTDTPEAVETPKKPRKAKDDAPTPVAVETATTTPEVTAPAEADAASPSEPTITLEQVRAKLTAISRSGKQAEVKGLIAKFGATKLTDLTADKFAGILTAAEAL